MIKKFHSKHNNDIEQDPGRVFSKIGEKLSAIMIAFGGGYSCV